MKVQTSLMVILTVLAGAAWTSVVCAQIGADPEVTELNWPDTTSGRWAEAFFETYSIDRKDSWQRFIKEHYSETALDEEPLETKLAGYLQMRRMLGELTIHSLKGDSDFAIEVIVYSKLRGGWGKFRFEFSPEPPHDITLMSSNPSSPPDTESAEDYQNWKDLPDLLRKIRLDADLPAIAAAIVRDGKIVEKAAVGIRRFDKPGRVQIGDRFHLGSVTKPITATMIGKLLEQEVLRWDMTVGGVLHDLPMRDEYRGVTLEELLQHRGGVPNLPSTGQFSMGLPPYSGRSPAEARAALVRQVLTEEPVKPGEYNYSSAGYVVAAHIAERVTKRPWEELMHSLVFEPLKMRSAGFGWPADVDRPDQPSGHLGAPPHPKVQEIGEYEYGDINYVGPAANVHCSIEDLARYAIFHLNVLNGREDALKARTVRRFRRGKKANEREDMYCAFGSGGTFYAMLAVYPDSDLGVVVATNCGDHALPFLKKIRDTIHRRMTNVRNSSSAKD